ncbi:MAG: flagellar hook-length control protein FliK [Thermomonas sp.]|uniref:flagellar hook-length control protein FliK n=1 Tax=Thermomonas sp. TaxID=1971895 RepID=UPI001EB220B2|nr:flagellar hook-length control protein FliK [Thermomonas sp.]MBV2210349.1 flagellar hook-length control protein FliK [Thermomonas sp.]
MPASAASSTTPVATTSSIKSTESAEPALRAVEGKHQSAQEVPHTSAPAALATASTAKPISTSVATSNDVFTLAEPAANAVHAQPSAVEVRPMQQVAPAPVSVLQQPTQADAGYGDELNSHVLWMAGQQISRAEIRVNPKHLGAIDIQLQLDGNQIRAEFSSAQPDVRHALEASIPALRDMLSQQGFQLAHAGVGQQQTGQPQEQAQHSRGAPFAQQGNEEGVLPGEPDPNGGPNTPRSRPARGLLDVYA